MYLNTESKARTQNIWTQKTIFFSLLYGDVHIPHCQGILLPHIDIAQASADGISPDNEPLEHAMRIPFEQASIHISPRVSLIGIHNDVLDISGGIAALLPLSARRKSSATTTAKVSFLYFFDYPFRGHLGEGLRQCGIPAKGDVILYILGVDFAVISEDNSHLILVEWYFGFVSYPLTGERVNVEETIDNFVLEYGLGNDLRGITWFYFRIADFPGVNNYQRPLLAETVAASPLEVNFGLQPLFL
ncbi:hypothetical protein ES703_06017 [subsurface metagenome]